MQENTVQKSANKGTVIASVTTASMFAGILPAMTVGLNALPFRQVSRAMSMNHVAAQITASVAVVLFSLFFEAKRSVYATLMPVQEAEVLAVQQLFLAMGVMVLFAVPVSLRWMRKKHRGQLDAACACKR
ncbi:multidrug efflux MFS transporter [Paenibacillus naphthalenovorans]|uniref:multidrug efflux MFS transporter n=1 Tax=Paenibacillus naphthalenovorans TaxID=162209 RepID=UPI000882167F|nr:multidrug efflux MFS transporter [Paenibacillus naphthalenovorans]SDH98582.1 hypothetical protein SAMN05421868_102132 [Paenibacillus naphthalenovorans]